MIVPDESSESFGTILWSWRNLRSFVLIFPGHNFAEITSHKINLILWHFYDSRYSFADIEVTCVYL